MFIYFKRETIQQFFSIIDTFKDYRNTSEFLTYKYKKGEISFFTIWGVDFTLVPVNE